MDFFHCNVCYIQPEGSKGLTFFLTSCGHSFCHKCLDSKSKCKLCHAECRIIPLSREMPENLKSLFSDTAQEAKKTIRILSIQNNHCKIYMEQYAPYLEKKCMHLRQKLDEKMKEIESLNNKLKLLSTQMDGMKKDMIKMTSRMPKTPLSHKPQYSEFKVVPNSQCRLENSVFMTPATSVSTTKSNLTQSYLHRTPMNMAQNAPSIQSDRSNMSKSFLHRTPMNMAQNAPSIRSDRSSMCMSQNYRTPKNMAQNAPSIRSDRSSMCMSQNYRTPMNMAQSAPSNRSDGRSMASTPQSFHSSQTFVMANKPNASEHQTQKKWGSYVTQIRATNLRQIKSLSSRNSNPNSSYF